LPVEDVFISPASHAPLGHDPSKVRKALRRMVKPLPDFAHKLSNIGTSAMAVSAIVLLFFTHHVGF